MEKTNTLGFLRVVDKNGIEMASQEGWKLVERYEERSGWHSQDGEHGGSSTTYFLMSLNEEDSLAIASERYRKLRDEMKGFEEARKEDREALEYVRSDLTIARLEVERLTEHKKNTEAALKASRQMEVDISKIQAAIGSERMNLILAGKKFGKS